MTPFFKQTWFIGGVAALAIFALCFLGINYVGQPDEEKGPEVDDVVIATIQTNEPLITIARQQGWIEADATEMSSIDASKVKELGTAFQSSKLTTFSELQHFVGLTEIHAGAFAHSDGLTAITIPAYVITIEDGALSYCPALQEIKVDTANTHYDSRGNCNAIICSWKGELMLVAGCVNTVIPEDVRYIAPQAFAGCTNLKKISFPERMKEIGEEAFKDCQGLETVEIPQGVRFVKPGMFKGCSSLRELTLSKSVERLQKDAFAGCSSLTTINCGKKYPPIIENAFDEYKATVYVPNGMTNTYYRDKFWKDFPTVKELP
ncbi:MAG: leucine-rich repeat domain-containing protein [Prevotella sp.]|nr:leucine-rich repeat domain-containing protein [Prevotella sp.]